MTQGFPGLRMALEMSQLFPARWEAEALNQVVAQDEGSARSRDALSEDTLLYSMFPNLSAEQ